ncbi:hypothetical protein GQ457_09G010180 [Hibiscus cannabinus]
MPPRRSARISSVRGRGRGRGQSTTSHEDLPPPPPPPAGNQEEIPNASDAAVPVGRAHQADNQPAQNESQTARQSHEEELVDSDDETVEADNATVNRELLRFLRGKPGGPRRAISADFIEAGMEIFKGKSNVDPSDAEHWLKDLQRLFVEMDYPVDRKVRAAVSLLSGEALDWWESVVESVSAGRVTWDFFRKSFEDRYVGEEYYEKCRQDFLDLKQNNMTVNAYEMQFLKLLRYAGGLVTTEKQKCDAFRKGLRFFIRERVALHHDTELSKLVARAKTAETIEALKKNERQHNVDRGRRPYNAPAQSGLVNQFGKRPRDSDRLSHSRVEPVPSAAPVVSGGGSSAPREPLSLSRALPHPLSDEAPTTGDSSSVVDTAATVALPSTVRTKPTLPFAKPCRRLGEPSPKPFGLLCFSVVFPCSAAHSRRRLRFGECCFGWLFLLCGVLGLFLWFVIGLFVDRRREHRRKPPFARRLSPRSPPSMWVVNPNPKLLLGLAVRCGCCWSASPIVEAWRPVWVIWAKWAWECVTDPVVIASGQTFERTWIQKWFDDGNDTCPKTEMKLDHLSLTPNAAMKDLITKWCRKYGITIQDPSMQPDALPSLENSSSSIASFGSSMNDLHFPLDISNISLGSLDTSYTSNGSRNRNEDGSSLMPEQASDDLRHYQSLGKASETNWEYLSGLVELDRESQYKMVEDIKNHLQCDDLDRLSLSSKNFIEPLIRFLSSANDLHDLRGQRAGFQLLSTFLSKNRNGTRYLSEDAYRTLSLFIDSEVTQEVLDIMLVMSEHSSCGSKIYASGALFSMLNILNSNIKDFQEQILKILCNLSSSSTDICSDLVSSGCIPKLVSYLQDSTLARRSIVVLRNLCSNQEARTWITQTSGCIASIASLLETGVHEDQEHAVAILLMLCSQSNEYCHLVMDECCIFPVLSVVSVNGSEKGKASAMELLRLLGDTMHDNGDDEHECSNSKDTNSEECSISNDIDSEDANDNSKEKMSRKTFFRVKLPKFSRSSAPKK